MQFDITLLFTFLVGALSGAAGQYLADKYTDKRKYQEAQKASVELVKKVRSLMPELISEMKEDVMKQGYETVREFVLLPNERVPFNSGGKQRFVYFANKTPDLIGKVQILEQEGLVMDVTRNNTPIYRMTETFVELLKIT
jgi:hypothetical protein